MGAKETGMYTVRLMRGEFMTVQSIGESVDAQVKDYYELEDLISNLNIDSTWRHP
jgi:hypothetical protein